jgi:hypothetical protein
VDDGDQHLAGERRFGETARQPEGVAESPGNAGMQKATGEQLRRRVSECDNWRS